MGAAPPALTRLPTKWSSVFWYLWHLCRTYNGKSWVQPSNGSWVDDYTLYKWSVSKLDLLWGTVMPKQSPPNTFFTKRWECLRDVVTPPVPISFLVRVLEEKGFCSLFHFCIWEVCPRGKYWPVGDVPIHLKAGPGAAVAPTQGTGALPAYGRLQAATVHLSQILWCFVLSPIPDWGNVYLWCDIKVGSTRLCLYHYTTADVLTCTKEDFFFSIRVKCPPAELCMGQFLWNTVIFSSKNILKKKT